MVRSVLHETIAASRLFTVIVIISWSETFGFTSGATAHVKLAISADENRNQSPPQRADNIACVNAVSTSPLSEATRTYANPTPNILYIHAVRDIQALIDENWR